MATLDPRLAAALNDEATALAMLAELHRQITTCRDENALGALLGRYVAVAAAKYTLSSEPLTRAMRSALPIAMGTMKSAPQQEGKRHATMVRIMQSARMFRTA